MTCCCMDFWSGNGGRLGMSSRAAVNLPSVWHREAAVPATRWGEGPGPTRVDLAIVGGGLMAAWLAYHASARAGGRWTITVFSDRALAHGASGRNAGFVLGGTSELYATLVGQLGRPAARELLALSQRNRQLVRAMLGPDGDRVEYRETGSLYLGAPDEGETLAKTVRWLVEDGVAAESWPMGQVPPSLRSLGLPRAAFFPEDGAVQPVHLVAMLVGQARRAGVQWYTGARVGAWTLQDGAGVRLTVGGDHVLAERVVLCTNAWLGQLVPALARVVRPTRGQVLATGPVALDYSYPVYADHGYLYWRPRPDGSLVLGGRRNLDFDTEATDVLALNPRIQDALTALAARLAGGPVAVTDRWAGIMGFTPDHLPLVGPVAPGLWVAGGFGGHGVAMTGAVGDLLAQHLLSAAPLPRSLDPTRFHAPA